MFLHCADAHATMSRLFPQIRKNEIYLTHGTVLIYFRFDHIYVVCVRIEPELR